MIVKPFIAKFSAVGHELFLRCDPKYRHFWDNLQGTPIKQNKFENMPLRFLMLPFTKKIIEKGILEEERKIVELEDVEPKISILLQERTVLEIGSNKLDFCNCDLVISKLRPYLGKIVLNDVSKRYVGTTEWIPLKIDAVKADKVFLKHLLLLPDFLHCYNFLLSGKQHPRMDEIDFYNILVPYLSQNKQRELGKHLIKLENKIISVYNQLEKPVEIVNEVFSNEFAFDMSECVKKSTTKHYMRNFSDFDKDFILRSSVNFQHIKHDYINEIFQNYKWVKLKTLLLKKERVHRGTQPIYDEDGSIRTIKTNNIKNETIDTTEIQMVNELFYTEHKDEADITKGDVLITCTGVGSVGKVDIYEFEEKAIADSHVAIMRFDKAKVLPLFMTYFLRSILGSLQVERQLSGSTNQIEIYPDQLEQIRVICPSQEVQKLMIRKIKPRIDKVMYQKIQIRQLRYQMDELIENVINQK